MSAKFHVTLSEVVQVASPPLKERIVWVLLHLASSAVQDALKGSHSSTGIIILSWPVSTSPSPFRAARMGPGDREAEGREMLITPESLLLYPGGRLEVLSGVYDSTESQFRAPEMSLHGEHSVEKVYTCGSKSGISYYCYTTLACVDARLCPGSHPTSVTGELRRPRGEYHSLTPAAGNHDSH